MLGFEDLFGRQGLVVVENLVEGIHGRNPNSTDQRYLRTFKPLSPIRHFGKPLEGALRSVSP